MLWITEWKNNNRIRSDHKKKIQFKKLNNGHEANDDDDDDDYYLFYEGDSDDDRDDDFSKISLCIESNHWKHCAIYSDEEDRRCLKLRLCHKDQHTSQFKGYPVLELFKVRLQLNNNLMHTPMHGQIYGEIATFHSEYDRNNPFSVTYYSVSRDEPVSIDLDTDRNKFVFLPITGPEPRPAFSEDNHLTLDFAFKWIDGGGKDLFNEGVLHENQQLFGDDGCNADTMFLHADEDRCEREGFGPHIVRTVVGNVHLDPVLMGAYYTVYYGSWARIDVKMVGYEGVTGFYGLVVARSCIFTSRVRLLTVKRDDHGRGEVDRDTGCIKLTRSVVTVPVYASLIIGAELYGDDDELICRGKTAFAAKESGKETRFISYNGVKTLEVTVRWECWGKAAKVQS